MSKFKMLITAMLLSAMPVSLVHAGSGCSAKAKQIWALSVTQKLSVEALSDGPSCSLAVVMLVIRNSKGEPLWIESNKASGVFTFTQANPANTKAMTEALKEWIMKDDRLQQAGALPDWKPGADAPEASEFPFYTDEGITRDDYLNMRNAKLPMFCYVAGIESEACLVLNKDGTIVKVGSQSFPG